MHIAYVKPIAVKMGCILPTCSHLATLKWGVEIHEFIIKSGFDSDMFVGTTLITCILGVGK
jgi:hypothetical protein